MTAKQLHDFYFYDLKWRGYGEPINALKFLADVIEVKQQWHYARIVNTQIEAEVEAEYTKLLGKPYESMVALSYLYVLCAYHLIEHGVDIWQAQPTPKGLEVAKAIRTYNLEKVLKFPTPDWKDDEALKL